VLTDSADQSQSVVTRADRGRPDAGSEIDGDDGVCGPDVQLVGIAGLCGTVGPMARLNR
jgi:hypothetical protein